MSVERVIEIMTTYTTQTECMLSNNVELAIRNFDRPLGRTEGSTCVIDYTEYVNM